MWEDAQPRLARTVYGPHLEWLAAEWVLGHAQAESVGGSVRLAAPTVLRAGGRRYQIDVVGVEAGRGGEDRVCLLGEAKAEREAMGATELERLDTIARLVAGRSKPSVQRLLVARGGFTSELRRVARQRGDVTLLDLDRLYHGE